MKYGLLIAVIALTAAGCGNDSNNGSTNNGSTNNGSTNNGSTNNGSTNNGSTGTNNATTNNGSTGTNNTTTNNGSTGTNNGTTNNGTTNNGTTGPVGDFIAADVDGTRVVATEEGGIEPMGETVQLRKTTGADSTPVRIFRISLPNTDVATYDCATDTVSVTYSELNGQLVANWVSSDTCTIEVTASGEVVTGTFTASTSDGGTTRELTNGEFSLTP